jgi:trafficking protein particle complex subunit 8
MNSPSLSNDNDDPLQRQPDHEPSSASTSGTLNVRKTRSPTRNESPEASTTSLPVRVSSPSTLASRTSTLVQSLSRSTSPNGRESLSLSRFGRSAVASPLSNPSERYDEVRSLIVRAFSPTVAVYGSDQADALARAKGIQSGFVGLVRPFGEKVSGKIVVRDSVGASRAWDDFGVHFRDLGALASEAASSAQAKPLEQLEEVMERLLETHADQGSDHPDSTPLSTFYKLFLSRLLQAHTLSPHETFLHPVAAVIVISSSTPSPIDTLRHLYQQTAQGSRTLPPYANPEYLRYYLLVHDEDHDDIAKSTALFDQMKRHFGLHCHLLRLRSVTPSQEDEAEEVPPMEWLSPSEDFALASQRNLIELGTTNSTTIFASDATAIRTFIRELVAQSVVPHMEQRIALWNEQVASRRRGISGRFMSISKRWAGIGSSARSTSSATNLTGSSGTGNYDGIQGYYRYDVPEALLRKLADFAFMLRDYKLAASTLELVRSDYGNDKAWRYQAGANEICYVANLLNPLTGNASAKVKMEAFDQMLETASYSYLTRCNEPALALRSMLLGVELLKVRGKVASEMASKWAIRTLELGLVGSVGRVLVSERIASSFAGQVSVNNTSWGARKRKAAFWNVMTADEWMKLGKAELAAERLDEAHELYADTKHSESLKEYHELDRFMQQLELAVKMKLGQGRHRGLSGASQVMDQEVDDEIVEDMTALEKIDSRTNRRSVLGPANGLDALQIPRSPARSRSDPLGVGDDDFE